MHRFDTQLKFDPDGSNDGKPNLMGAMTTVFIPKQDLLSIPNWVPSDWIGHTNYINNPVNEYTWNISEKSYAMRQWLLHYFVTLNIEWDGSERPGGVIYDPYNYYGANTAIWLKFTLEPIYYIQGAEVAYFAIGKMQLSETVQYLGWTGDKDILGQKVLTEKNDGVSVSPESQGEVCYIFYDPNSGSANAQTNEYYYQGKLLNPDLFKPAVYARIDLNKFGVYSWNDFLTLRSKGDVATFSFDISVFEIGQWTVQDIQNDPDGFGRFVRVGSTGGWGEWVTENLWWLIPAAIFLVILFFAPWIIVLLVSIFR